MAVETSQAIIASTRTRVITDPTMLNILGDPHQMYRWPNLPNDPPLPYWTQRLDLSAPLFHSTHSYFLDLFYYGDDSAVVDSAIDRLKILFHEWQPITGDSEINGSLLEWFSGGYIPTDNVLVWQYATQWDLRFGAARDITNIIGA